MRTLEHAFFAVPDFFSALPHACEGLSKDRLCTARIFRVFQSFRLEKQQTLDTTSLFPGNIIHSIYESCEISKATPKGGNLIQFKSLSVLLNRCWCQEEIGHSLGRTKRVEVATVVARSILLLCTRVGAYQNARAGRWRLKI